MSSEREPAKAAGARPSADVLIVGGGSAGAVLAARLSEDEQRRVLLIEAGPDTPPGQEAEDVLDVFYLAAYNKAYLWPDLRVHATHDGQSAGRSPIFYTQARIMGGGSSINSMVAQRGNPGDFARWVALGAEGWSWDDVLPYYRKLENDLDFDGPMHNKEGPMPIRRHRKSDWPPLCRALEGPLRDRGFQYVADMNALPVEQGYCALPMTSWPTRRASTAIAYLTADVRKRSNLHILPNTQVERLLINEARVTGVRARRDHEVLDLAAREVIVSAGTLHSPALLLRSGIGPQSDLRQLGIPVAVSRDGVGRNLHDHASVTVAAHLKPAAKQPESLRAHGNLALRYYSGEAGCDENDMYISMMNKTSWHPLGKRLASMVVVLNQPYSRGELKLRTPDPHDEAIIKLNVLQDDRDCRRLAAGMRFAATLLSESTVRPLVNEMFPAIYSERIAKISEITATNWFRSLAGSLLMDGPAPLRRFLVRNVLTRGGDLAQLLRSERALEAWLRSNASGFFHAVGSCRMGQAKDQLAVVDSSGRVHGVEGLRVVDASIMPHIVRATPHLTVIMVAEKIADHVRRESKGHWASMPADIASKSRC